MCQPLLVVQKCMISNNGFNHVTLLTKLLKTEKHIMILITEKTFDYGKWLPRLIESHVNYYSYISYVRTSEFHVEILMFVEA